MITTCRQKRLVIPTGHYPELEILINPMNEMGQSTKERDWAAKPPLILRGVAPPPPDMQATPRQLAGSTMASSLRPPPLAILPPIPLYRRLLRGHRRHLPGEMRLLGDQYVKAEFRAHRTVDNPAHIVSPPPQIPIPQSSHEPSSYYSRLWWYRLVPWSGAPADMHVPMLRPFAFSELRRSDS